MATIRQGEERLVRSGRSASVDEPFGIGQPTEANLVRSTTRTRYSHLIPRYG